jgi:hypothetical protein
VFDEDLTGAGLGAGTGFSLYTADGIELSCAGGFVFDELVNGGGENTDNIFVCASFGAATNAQVASAKVGTVDNDVVTSETTDGDGTSGNPEGASLTSAAPTT